MVSLLSALHLLWLAGNLYFPSVQWVLFGSDDRRVNNTHPLKHEQVTDNVQSNSTQRKEKHFPKNFSIICKAILPPKELLLNVISQNILFVPFKLWLLQSMGNWKQFIQKTSQGFQRTMCTDRQVTCPLPAPSLEEGCGLFFLIQVHFFPLNAITSDVPFQILFSALHDNTIPQCYASFIDNTIFMTAGPCRSALSTVCTACTWQWTGIHGSPELS